jgi:hypothetical protein
MRNEPIPHPYIICKNIADRPELYVGQKDIRLVSAFIKGYSLPCLDWYEPEIRHLMGFSLWIERKIYGEDVVGRDWSEVLRDLALFNEDDAFILFKKYFSEYSALYSAPS